MRVPEVQGVIDRRVLVNYRVDPCVLASLLPAPFQPKTIRGSGFAGICLIRLKYIRPRRLPRWAGISSENAAHRIAVEWTEAGTLREGVYIPRRDTNSRINSAVGGRLFPGEHNFARFDVEDSPDHLRIHVDSDDGRTRVRVRCRAAGHLPSDSVFSSTEEASEFFRAGSLGYSVKRDPSRLDALELNCEEWRVEPLHVESVESSFFDDPVRFPRGTIHFDNALLMRAIPHTWRSRGELCCTPATTAAPV